MIDYKRNKRVLIYDTTAVSTDKYNAGANDSANTCSRRFHYYRARSALRFHPHRDAKIHTYIRTYVLSYIGGDKIIFYHAARFSLSPSLSLSRARECRDGEYAHRGHPVHHVFNGRPDIYSLLKNTFD